MESGKLIDGRFELDRLVGRGSMGLLFEARDRLDGRPVAVKLLGRAHAKARERFAREARILSGLAHPGIVGYIAHGIGEGETDYLAMEWLEGKDLAQRLAEGPLTIAESIDVAARVAESLGAAHRYGVVHRDVKPSNIFLVGGRLEQPKLLDFGVARLLDASTLTVQGAPLGTPRYMAPEQAKGEEGIDARADVFSLGCVLYECLSRKPAFAGDHPLAVLARIVLEDPLPIGVHVPDVPGPIATLLGRMLSKVRELRPASGGEVAGTLRSLGRASAPPPTIPPPGLTDRERRVLTLAVLQPRGGQSGAADDLRTLADAHGAELYLLRNGYLLLTWFASDAPADAARQASSCALALCERMPRASVSVVTGLGELTAGPPVGELVDRAVAALGEGIRLDPVTASLLPAGFELSTEGAFLRLRGRGPSAPRTLLGRATPCVGREHVLRMLEDGIEACASDEGSQAVVLTGPPGIGKSRVAYELLSIVTRRFPHVMVWAGEAEPLRAESPYALLGGLLRRIAGVREGDPPDAHQARVDSFVARRVAAVERQRVAEFLAELMRIPPATSGSDRLRAARRDPSLMTVQVRRAFEDLLGAVLESGPVLIVLEDLHWADAASIRLVEAALRRFSDRSLLVLGTARPEVHERFPELFQGLVHVVALRPLSKRASAELVRVVLADRIADARVDALVALSEGNPFYLEELIRAEAEGRGGTPPSVLAMVQSRLEGLSGIDRRVLRAASVFGEVFWLAGAAAVADCPPDDAAAAVDRLAAAEIVGDRAGGRFAGEREIAFRHALLRDGALAMLTEEDLRTASRLAAAWLEQMGEQDAVVLAEHYERGAHPRKAALFWVRAGLQAIGANDNEAAIARAARAIELGAAGDERAEALLIQAEAYRLLYRYEDSVEPARRVLETAERASTIWFRAAAELALAYYPLEAAAETAEVGRMVAGARPRDARSVGALSIIAGHLAITDGDMVLVDRLSTSADAIDDPALLDADARGWRHAMHAMIAVRDGDFAAMMRHSEEAKRAFEEAANPRRLAVVLFHMAWNLMKAGDFRQAERLLGEAIEIGTRLEIGAIRQWFPYQRPVLLGLEGRDAEARDEARRALSSPGVDSHAETGALVRTILAAAHLALGEIDLAERAAVEAERFVRERRRERLLPFALAVRGEVLLARGDAAGALALAREAIEIVDGRPIEVGESAARLLLARALEAIGDMGEAKAAIRDARDRLLERASAISSDELRRTFLEQVPDNRRTLEHAARFAGQ